MYEKGYKSPGDLEEEIFGAETINISSIYWKFVELEPGGDKGILKGEDRTKSREFPVARPFPC